MYFTGASTSSPGARSSSVASATDTYAPPISSTTPSVYTRTPQRLQNTWWFVLPSRKPYLPASAAPVRRRKSSGLIPIDQLRTFQQYEQLPLPVPADRSRSASNRIVLQ